MKIYYCKFCIDKKEKFSGNRQQVRKHLREEHFIKGKRASIQGESRYVKSPLTKNTIAVELE